MPGIPGAAGKRWRAMCVRHGGPGAVHGGQPGAATRAGRTGQHRGERANAQGIEVVVTFKTAAAR